jgi:hypothetical protein
MYEHAEFVWGITGTQSFSDRHNSNFAAKIFFAARKLAANAFDLSRAILLSRWSRKREAQPSPQKRRPASQRK